MKTTGIILAVLLTAAPHTVFAQAQTDTLTPTIPATQIEALQLATPYEFLSASTGVDEFEVKAADLAATLAESNDVKIFAERTKADHLALVAEAKVAGKADKADIAGATIDGEQQGLLTKMEGLRGAAFDRAYAEAQVFVHQRAVAVYKGYAEKDTNLGRFAAATLPKIVSHFEEAQRLAAALGAGGAQ